MKYNYLFLILIFFPSFLFSQHKIKATFTPAEDFTWAILYKTTPTSNKYGGQGKVEDGKVVFNLNEKTKPGIYNLVYGIPQHELNFDVIYDGKEDIELTFIKDKGVVFQTSEVNLLLSSYRYDMNLINTQIGEFYVQEKTNFEELTGFFKSQREVQDLYEEKSKGTLAYHFIVAEQPYIPSAFDKKTVYFKNTQETYFKYVDFNNPIIQSSRFLMDRTLSYIFGAYNQGTSETETYNINIDKIFNHLKDTEVNFRKIFLSKLWDKFVLYNYIDNANYLSEKYLTPLATQQNDQKLVDKLTQFKNLSIGNPAPDFTWETTKNGIKKTNKLSELAVAENYILIFWSSTCSHCLKEIPLLNGFVNTLDSSKYKVVAVGLEDGPEIWKKEIKKYPNFINVIKLKKWDSQIVQDYGLTSTPTYFILDRDKKFIAKPETLEELQEFINKQ